jgi:hypothetical protein
LTETKRDLQDISSYFYEESNSKASDREDDQTYFLPNFSLEYRGKWDSIDHTKVNWNIGFAKYDISNQLISSTIRV